MARARTKRSRRERAPLGDRLVEWLLGLTPRALLVAISGVVAFGTVGYMIFAGLDLLEALYMALITVSTVGYTDLAADASAASRLFTVVYLVLGVAVFSVTISALAAALVAGVVREALGRRRMERQIHELSGHLILCGFGNIGRITAQQIREKHVPLVVIDVDPKRVDEADEDGLLGLMADATEESTLLKAGLERASALLCTLPSDAENVYAILTAREIRPDIRIVALSRGPGAENKLRAAGANDVVSPFNIGARHMARQVLSPHVARVMSRAAGEEGGLEQVGVRLEEFLIDGDSALVGQSLRDSPIRREFGVILLAVINADGDQRFNPGPDLVLEKDAVLVSVGPPDGLRKLGKACLGR